MIAPGVIPMNIRRRNARESPVRSAVRAFVVGLGSYLSHIAVFQMQLPWLSYREQAANSMIPAETETFKDSASPGIGMETRKSH